MHRTFLLAIKLLYLFIILTCLATPNTLCVILTYFFVILINLSYWAQAKYPYRTRTTDCWKRNLWIFRFLAKAQNDNALVILSDSEVSIQKNGEWIAEFMDFSLRSKWQMFEIFCCDCALQPIKSLCANALRSKWQNGMDFSPFWKGSKWQMRHHHALWKVNRLICF